MTTTFVTSYAKIHDDDNECEKQQNTEWRFTHFRELAKTGVKICLYGSENTFHLLEELENEFPNNVKLMSLKWENTPVYKMYEEHFNDETMLPKLRRQEKDTAKYMTLMNSKIDFVNDTVSKNPFNTENFAWIDFSIFYIFKNKNECHEKIKQLSTIVLPNKNCVYIPGVWDKLNDDARLSNEIYWRFCGGVFIGSSKSIQQFYKNCLEVIDHFIKHNKKLVWEINTWAKVENHKNNNIIWYYGDHTEKILNVPFINN